MNSQYTITVTSRTDSNALRALLLEVIKDLEEGPKVIEVRLDYNTARGRTPGQEHNPVIRTKRRVLRRRRVGV